VIVATTLFVVPARINVSCFRSSAVILPPFPRWIPRPTIDRLIPARDRSDDYVRGELRQSSSTAHHNFHLARSVPLKTISSSEISQPPFLPSLSCSSSSPFTSLFIVAVVVMLFYFSSYSRIQFCVLLPPVTLAENNNNICSPPMNKERQWFDPCCS